MAQLKSQVQIAIPSESILNLIDFISTLPDKHSPSSKIIHRKKAQRGRWNAPYVFWVHRQPNEPNCENFPVEAHKSIHANPNKLTRAKPIKPVELAHLSLGPERPIYVMLIRLWWVLTFIREVIFSPLFLSLASVFLFRRGYNCNK